MTSISTKSFPTPWAYEFNPYTAQDGSEIPAYVVLDAEGDTILDTNENTPAELQEAIARLACVTPEMAACLHAALHELRGWMSMFPDGSNQTPLVIEEIERVLAESQGANPNRL
ncbi:MAG: hypothetical protein K8U57_28505 [Planctomycetes bacterium]|nr:hypothetical protein [Planctomycetota bacterium]